MGTTVYAVESWVLSLLGWSWLSVQEMLGWSLLSAHAFLGMLLLSTCNVLACGVAPESAAPRSAYFAAVLALTLHCLCCVLDTVPMPAILTSFVSPSSIATCTLARSNQLFFFNDAQLYLAQAGATLAYLVVQLVIAGAGMLDSDRRSLWPGPSWGGAIYVLLCGRFISTFDGMAKGHDAVTSGKYMEILSQPVVEFVVVFTGFMYLFVVLVGMEGLLFPGLAWRKTSRYVTFPAVLLFVAFAGYAVASKGLLTPALIGLLVLPLVPAIAGLVEAVQAVPLPFSTPGQPPQQVVAPPSFVPAGWPGGRPPPVAPAFPWPGQAPYQGRPPPAVPRQQPLRELRHVIPSPVEMLSASMKNKGV